jgi:UDP-N-acetylmuramate dehydrogenase
MNNYGVVIENANLKDYNTYKINSKCKFLIIVNDIVKLTNLIKYLEDNNDKYFIIGNGSNIILPEFYDGIIIKLDFGDITINKNIVTIGASYLINKLAIITANNNLSGLEFASGIPGTIGASVINNAGAYNDEIMNYVDSIEVLENNKIKIIKKEDIEYSYRHTSLKKRKLVIIKVILKLKVGDKNNSLAVIKERMERRIKSQPLEYPSAGSVFRNPEGDYAARLIESLNLKGYQIGGAKISEKHANFIVNNNNATGKDIIKLINYVHQKVLETYNIDLILEQEIIN